MVPTPGWDEGAGLALVSLTSLPLRCDPSTLLCPRNIHPLDPGEGCVCPSHPLHASLIQVSLCSLINSWDDCIVAHYWPETYSHKLCEHSVINTGCINTFSESDTINITAWSCWRIKLTKVSWYNVQLSLSFTFCSVRFQPSVYYKCKIFKSNALWRVERRRIFLVSFNAGELSDWVTNILVSQKMTGLQNIALNQTLKISDQQKEKRP